MQTCSKHCGVFLLEHKGFGMKSALDVIDSCYLVAQVFFVADGFKIKDHFSCTILS